MRAHFTGGSASGMALAGLARVPGYKVSIATLAPLVLMPLVIGFDARAGLPEGTTFPWLLSRSKDEVPDMAARGPTTRVGYGTGATRDPLDLQYPSTDRGFTVPLPRPAQDDPGGVLRGIFRKKIFVKDFGDAPATDSEGSQKTYGAVSGSIKGHCGRQASIAGSEAP